MREPAAPCTDERHLIDPDPSTRRGFGAAFERLVGVMARLREACPWDRAQTLDSLKTYLLEEAYEVLEAIDADDPEAHLEELGDLLLQVVFQAEIRRGEGAFDAADVAHTIADKLVRRHPHVFGDGEAADPAAVAKTWEQIKAAEKADKAQPDQSIISGVPAALPALLRAQRITDKASRAGFDWDGVEGPLDKVREEVDELAAAIEGGDRAAIEHELGDALFSLVNVARFLDMDPEGALRGTIDRFAGRFRHIEAAARAEGRPLSSMTLAQMEAHWQAAKARE